MLPALGSYARPQGLSIGLIGGTNLTDDVRSGRQTFPGGTLPSGETSSSTYIFDPGARRAVIGIQFGYQFSHGWALEVDALHRELKSTRTILISPPIELPNGQSLSALGPNTRTLTPWEFPLLGKYRIPMPRLNPFVSAGPSFRPAGTGTGLFHVGFTAGAGVEVLAAGFRIAPTLRYTRWASANAPALGSPLLNQVEMLVGIDRPAASGLRVFGQRLSLGVIAGIGLGQDFTVGTLNQSQRSEANNGVFGLVVEAHLPKKFAIEVNGLYRPLHGSDLEFDRRVRFAHLTWEFPILLKYRFPGERRLKLFAEGGPSLRAEGNLNLQPVSHFGATVGAGVESKFSWLRVSPVLRYTRWSDNGAVPLGSRTAANETQLLVAVTF